MDSYCKSYYSEPGKLHKDSVLVSEILQLLNPSTSDANVHVTRGLNMALGVLSESLLKDHSLGLG